MIRAAIADYIRAKAEKLRHRHDWKELKAEEIYDPYSFSTQPISHEYLYCCRGCGEFRKVTLP